MAALWLALSLHYAQNLTFLIGYAILSWLLVALAALDAEHFWLPDAITLPGIALGLIFSLTQVWTRQQTHRPTGNLNNFWLDELWSRIVDILIAAGIILIIRLAYWLVRRKEGMGLGDAKLMALLGAWLGLIGAIECFALAVLGASIAALIWLAISLSRHKAKDWAKMPLPLGTFLCLAALSELFYPAWFWNWWSRTFLLF